VRARLGVRLGAPALLLALIHRSAWNRNSTKFAGKEFSEVHIQDPEYPSVSGRGDAPGGMCVSCMV